MTDADFAPKSYRRIPDSVEAVAVTRRNLHQVAEWCGGTVEGQTIVIDALTNDTAKVGEVVVVAPLRRVRRMTPNRFVAEYEPVVEG